MFPRTLSQFPAHIGWAGGIGLALLGAAMVLTLTLIFPAQQEQTVLQAEVQKMTTHLQQTPVASPALNVRKQLDEFVATLPPHDALNNSLNALHDLAAAHHLALKDSAYRPAPNSSAAMQPLHISMKCEGSYTDLRHFLRAAAQTLPALAIEQLSFSRQKISDNRLEAVVEFSLFYSASDQPHS